MTELIVAVSYWMHFIATAVWIGGMFFILFITIPSAKQVMGNEAGKLMGEITKKFTPLANYSIVVLVITGIILTGFNEEFSRVGILGSKWVRVLSLKHILVLGMISIHFYRGLILAPKISKTVSETKKVFLQKLSLYLVKVNFGLGMVVLLLSGVIKAI